MKLKIVSLNLWLGGVLMDDILQFLTDQNADIVLLQEVYNGTDPSLARQYRSVQVLQDKLHYPYEDFVPDYRDFDNTQGLACRGNAVLSRLPIVDRNAIYFNNPYSETYKDVPGNFHNCPRDLQHVVLDSPLGQINVFNIQGAWDMDGDRFGEQRQQMSAAITKAIDGLPHVILGGDTNATPGNQAIKDIEAQLTNVFGRELASTFNMRRKDNPGYATAVVDMFFVSADIAVKSHDCFDVDISDHLPIAMTVDIL